jgi:hypothetical protein
MKRTAIAILLATTAAFLLGCGPLTLQRMQTEPDEYVGRLIELEVRVIETQDVPLVVDDYYKATDGTGQIWVKTRRGVPLKRARYKIEGIFKRPRGVVEDFLLGDFVLEEYSRTALD